jgi:hypothetical protein
MNNAGKLMLLVALLALIVPLICLSNPETTTAECAGIINGGFETGDFTGWNVSIAPGGQAQVVKTLSITTADNITATYNAKEGQYFALLTNGRQDVWTVVSRPFGAGTDAVISGWAFFKTSDYLPFTDESMVKITLYDGAVPIATLFQASVSTVGNYGGTPWTFWSYTFNTYGTYTIQAEVTNRLDSNVPSYLGLDDVCVKSNSPQQQQRPSPSMPATNATAQIVVKNMNATPDHTFTGQPITISANIANDGDVIGGYTASLKINGKVEQTKTGTVDAHSAVPVNFTVSRSQPGTYTFDIGGQKGTFTILADKTTSGSPVSSGTIAFIVISVLVLSTVVVLTLTFRRQT